MISYAFPQIVRDACQAGVSNVLRLVLSQTVQENVAQDEIRPLILEAMEGYDGEVPSFAVTADGPDLGGFAFKDLMFLLFRQEYTGFERDLSADPGLLSLLRAHYNLSEESEDMLWMTQHIYHTAEQNLLVPEEMRKLPEDFTTWTDERALDVMKKAIAPFGEDVDGFFAPMSTALEVQSDMKRAEFGDPNSMLEVAYDLIEGRGVEQDFKQAARWARQALSENTVRADEAKKMVDFLELLEAHAE